MLTSANLLRSSIGANCARFLWLNIKACISARSGKQSCMQEWILVLRQKIVRSLPEVAFLCFWREKKTRLVQIAQSLIRPGLALTGVPSSAPSVLGCTGQCVCTVERGDLRSGVFPQLALLCCRMHIVEYSTWQSSLFKHRCSYSSLQVCLDILSVPLARSIMCIYNYLKRLLILLV